MRKERRKKIFEDRVNTVVTLKLRDDLNRLRETIDLNHLTGREGKMIAEEREWQDKLGKDEEDIIVYNYDHRKKRKG